LPLPVAGGMNSLFSALVKKNSRVAEYDMPRLENFADPQERAKEKVPPVDPAVIEKQAYETGYAAGEKAGFEMGRKKAGLLLGQVQKLSEELVALKEKTLSEMEPQILLLAITMARKILQEELTLRPEIIHQLIKEAILKITKPDTITIKLSRPLYDLLLANKEDFEALHGDLLFELDPSLSGGGAVVYSSAEEVVTDLDFQLANMVEDLRTGAHHD
jgi:flagellar assembly protein FliH